LPQAIDQKALYWSAVRQLMCRTTRNAARLFGCVM